MSAHAAKTVVAMSGGVDSSVAALLLHRAGVPVIGVSMQVWDYRNHGGCSSRATCCAPDDFTDARRVAAKIGVPYYVFDFEKTFRTEVIDLFISTYAAGRTPNPCVDCNNKVKFRELRNRAAALGYPDVATGHYAQIEKRSDGFHLLRGSDPKKDQSYFLYGLKQEELAHTSFPVGHLTKDDVRALAREAGLVTADKAESQDICFVSGEVGDFLSKHGGKRPGGSIVDKNGKVLGTHDGIHQFTVGQRRGLKVGGTEKPLYVLGLRPEQNEVIVGSQEDLEQEGFFVNELSWVAPQILQLLRHEKSFDAIAQLRHRHQGVKVKVALNENGTVACTFSSEWSTVSPGQACVFYDLENREVLGGGRLVSGVAAHSAAGLVHIGAELR